MTKPRVYLIVDPQHEYGVGLIDAAARLFGARAVCLYTHARDELDRRPHFPTLRGHAGVQDHLLLPQHDWPGVARALRQRYDIVGVMPYFEQSVVPVANLLEHLHLEWNSAALLRRFRDKRALREAVRAAAPDVPLGMPARRVRSAHDVTAGPRAHHYVIKPNDGLANRDVGFFSEAGEHAALVQYFARRAPGDFVLEERFFGREYMVNGQVDAAGEVVVFNVAAYERTRHEDQDNVHHLTVHVPTTDPAFAACRDYARRVLQATGLRRSPFHLEMFLTASGPRLVEVACRFGGARSVDMTDDLHGGALDSFAAAAACYLGADPSAAMRLDWQHHDRLQFVHVDGMAAKSQRIYRVEGVEEVMAMPEFRRWVIRPEVGRTVHKTVDLYSIPYSLQLMAPVAAPPLSAVVPRVHRLIRINSRAGLGRRLVVEAAMGLRQAQRRARWLGLRKSDE